MQIVPENVPPVKKVFFFDTETHLFQMGCRLPPIVCLQYAYDREAPKIAKGGDESSEAFEVLVEALTDDSCLIVGHKVAFDLGVAMANWPVLTELIFQKLDKNLISCTLTREKLIRIATGEMSSDPSAGAAKQQKFNMAEIVKRRFCKDIEESKSGAESWRLRYHELENVPIDEWPEAAKAYALDDVHWTREIWIAQERDPAGYCDAPLKGLQRTPWGITDEGHQVRASFAFQLLEAWGNVTDPEMVLNLLHETAALVEECNEVLRTHGILKGSKHRDGSVTWSRDTKKIQKIILDALGENAPKTESGRVSISKDTWEKALEVMDTPHPALEALLKMAEANDTQVKWAQVLDQGTHGSIHPSYNPLVETGRTSCYKPNLQNPKREGGVRECFVPRHGNVFIFADYSTLELLALAQTCLDMFGYSKMAEALCAGKDLHLEVAAQYLGITYEEAVARKKEKEVKDARQTAKPFNFGVPGGLGYRSFAEFAWASYKMRLDPDPKVAEEKFRQMKNVVYYGAFPEMRDYHKLMGQICQGGPATVTQIPSGRIRGDVSFCVACNTFFQGRAADGAKRALYLVVRECYSDESSALYGFRPCFFLHDEIGLEGPEEAAPQAAKRLEEIMVAAMAEVIPDIPAKAEPVLGRRWYKGQEPVFVDGVLVPSKPQKTSKGVEWVHDPG